jgi:TIMELESS-interacting protein
MTSIDLYEDINEEYDLAMGDRDDEEGEDQENQNDDQNTDGAAKQDVNASVVVKKAKRKLVTLNAERLKGSRGIIAIDDFYKNIKLKGRGYEKEDLTEIMRRLEHWVNFH